MADVQKYFEQFHKTIRADYKSDAALKEKRDGILELLRERLREAERPSFRELLQGSYQMRTGVKPIEALEYDIDVGLRFDLDDDETAEDVRGWVYDAVKNRTNSVEEKTSCIRVGYAAGYHVDLVVYRVSKDDEDRDDTYELGRNDEWRPADPPALTEHFKTKGLEKFDVVKKDSSTSTNQLRRLVRYLKRWGDEAIPHESPDKPSGLAYTLLLIEKGAPEVDVEGEPDDLGALVNLCIALEGLDRIKVYKPTPEYEDLFGGLSDKAMEKLTARFAELKTTLGSARDESDPVKACETLHDVFGRDFPIPKPEDTGKKTKAPAIVPGSSSA